MRIALAASLLALAACGDNDDHGDAVFAWDTRVIGAFRIDYRGPDDDAIKNLLDDRAYDDDVAMFYGHFHDGAATADTIEALLQRAQQNELIVPEAFHDLVDGPPQRGVCLSFDDDDYPYWVNLRPLLAKYHARVTFFITYYPTATSDDKNVLRELADDGHDIQAHTITHPNGIDYVNEHGLQAFIDDEVEPSFEVLRADGYSPNAYAHPYGATTPEIERALLELPDVGMVRRITTR